VSAQGIFLGALASIALVIPAGGCRREAGREPPLTLTLAIQGTPYSGLIAVADEEGLFEEAGVDVRITLHSSGLDALRAMMRGEAQMVTVADVAFAGMMDEDSSLRVIGSIGTASGSEIVARRDRDINQPADLTRKRVGYSPGTTSQYFLRSFQLINQIGEITPVALPPGRQVEAIVAGDVDAVSAFEVYAYSARKQLGHNAVAWDSQNTLAYQWLLVTLHSATRPSEAMKRFLKALFRAEEIVLTHPEDAQAIIARKWELDPQFIRYLWSRVRLSVSFNQSIITALQSYGAWHRGEHGSVGPPSSVMPYIDTRLMEDVAPRSVMVFR
jgi:NitT/TauT family transport system substrate-binding protein